MGARGSHRRGTQKPTLIFTGLHPLPGSLSEWQLEPLSFRILSLHPCPGFLSAQPEAVRLTLQTVPLPLSSSAFLHISDMCAERGLPSCTEYSPFLSTRVVGIHAGGSCRQTLSGKAYGSFLFGFLFLTTLPVPPPLSFPTILCTEILLRLHSFGSLS